MGKLRVMSIEMSALASTATASPKRTETAHLSGEETPQVFFSVSAVASPAPSEAEDTDSASSRDNAPEAEDRETCENALDLIESLLTQAENPIDRTEPRAATGPHTEAGVPFLVDAPPSTTSTPPGDTDPMSDVRLVPSEAAMREQQDLGELTMEDEPQKLAQGLTGTNQNITSRHRNQIGTNYSQGSVLVDRRDGGDHLMNTPRSEPAHSVETETEPLPRRFGLVERLVSIGDPSASSSYAKRQPRLTPAAALLTSKVSLNQTTNGPAPILTEAPLPDEFSTVGSAFEGPRLISGHIVSAATGPAFGQQSVPQIAGSLTQLVGSKLDGMTEIQLSPEELGRIRMLISTHEHGNSVMILADRPETGEYLRRNIDMLEKACRDLGLEGTDISYGEERKSDQERRPDSMGMPQAVDPANSNAANTVPMGPKVLNMDRLDLRL